VLTCVTWKWGEKFGPVYVHRLKAMLARHLHVPHRFVCVADDPTGLEGIDLVPLPATYADTPRCRRRMWQFSREFGEQLQASRLLCLDLDLVFVRDISPLVQRPELVVCAWIEYAQVYSGSMILMTAGALDGLWQAFKADPDGYPVKAWPRGIGSDQAMLNYYIRKDTHAIGRPTRVGRWTKADGIVTYFGEGYERYEHLGVGPRRPALPAGTRVVVLGSDDKHVLETNAFPWVAEHWVEARA
jgi:hypothetical protein